MAADITNEHEKDVSDLTEEERLLFLAYATAAELALLCGRWRDINGEASETVLPRVMKYFVTELSDQKFGQSEISDAFGQALSKLQNP